MRIPRNIVLLPFSYFHMMWRTHNREFLLADHKEKLRYLRAVRDDYLKNCKPEDFVLNGYTMMSNHAHLNGSIGPDHKPLSDHMRRAHSRFGLAFNKRHKRLGKVAHDRPKIKASQDEAYALEVMLYDLFNPVRAGIIPNPTHVKWRQFSTARYLAYGEKNEFTDMITLPDWYLALADTAEERQQKFRQILDRYAVQKGLKQDPRWSRGHFVGGDQWMQDARRRVNDWVRAHRKKTVKAAAAGPDPPDSS